VRFPILDVQAHAINLSTMTWNLFYHASPNVQTGLRRPTLRGAGVSLLGRVPGVSLLGRVRASGSHP